MGGADFCQHIPINVAVFSYIIGASRQLNMGPGTEIGDETVKYQKMLPLRSFLVEASLTLFLTV